MAKEGTSQGGGVLLNGTKNVLILHFSKSIGIGNVKKMSSPMLLV